MSTATAPIQRYSPFAVFRNPSFTRLWLAQLISTIGDSFTTIAAGILIYQRTGSTLSVGIMLMATSLPSLLIGFLAGEFVDRLDRKKIMIAADISRGVLVFLIPILVPHSVVWLYLIVFLNSAIGTFFLPAYGSVIPEMASDEELTAANSMISISSFGSTAVGFAASGMLAAYSLSLAFYIDAASFIFSAILILGVQISPQKPAEVKTTLPAIGKNIQAGFKYLVGSSILRSLIIISALYAFMAGMVNTLLLPFATGALHATTFQYGLQEGLTSIGYVIGSLFMARFAYRMREGSWMVLGLSVMGITTIIYSYSSSVPFATTMVALSGLVHAPYAVSWITLLQRNTGRDMRGRVLGANMAIRNVLMLTGMAVAGLADLYSPRLLMQISGYINLGIGFVALAAPGIGRSAPEWVRNILLLRRAAQAPSLKPGRPATLADILCLSEYLPALSVLSEQERQKLTNAAMVVEAGEGSLIIRQGEISDAVFFVLKGQTIAGRTEKGRVHVMSLQNAGDFFGEIAALTGIQRTANVIAGKPSSLLCVPAAIIREMTQHPELGRLFMEKMTERWLRTEIADMPKVRFSDSQLMQELRGA